MNYESSSPCLESDSAPTVSFALNFAASFSANNLKAVQGLKLYLEHNKNLLMQSRSSLRLKRSDFEFVQKELRSSIFEINSHTAQHS